MYGLSPVFQVGDYSSVPDTWSLKPSGLDVGDEFRLIFLSSTKRNATSTTIDDYNTFVQNLAAAGHDDIQAIQRRVHGRRMPPQPRTPATTPAPDTTAPTEACPSTG